MKHFELLAIQKPPIAIAAILLTFASCASADFVFSTPTNLGSTINNSYDVMGVCISYDGLELYFSSNQAGGYGGYDLMVSTRESTEHNWSVPVNLGGSTNTRYDAWEPSISTNGLTLYFSDPHYPPFGNLHPRGLGGQGDIWMTVRATTDDPWGAPVNLGPAINSQHAMSPHISADDLSLYFNSHRPGSSGQCDIMMASRKTSSENFGSPTFLSHINSNGNDWSPEISSDGLKLFFMSNMDNPSSTSLNSLQLWMASRMSVSEPFKAPVKLPSHINMAGYGAFWPSLSPDCSVLYFVSDRPGGFGGYDLWQVRITPIVDFNADGIVDSSDMCIMVDHWGEDYPLCDIGPTPWGDGSVDVEDLKVLAAHLFEDYRLVAHWALDETEGIIAKDSSGYNDAYVIGDPLWQPAEGKKDGALQLDGINDYVVSVSGFNPADGPFSVFAWIKGGAPGQVIISQMDGTGSGETWLGMDAVNGCLMTGLVPPSVGRYTPQPLVSESIITDSQWHHVGFVWDGFYRILYVDGTEVTTDAAVLAPLNFSNGGLCIGTSKILETGTFFSGMIDDVRIYNQALTADEIAELVQ